MSPVPIVYRKASPITVSFDWVDYVANIGYKRFYCARGHGVGYVLTPSVVSSSGGATAATIYRYTTATGAAALDLDFDITFGTNATVGGGDCFISWPCSYPNGQLTTTTVTINHDDGTTETALGTNSIAMTAGAAVDTRMSAFFTLSEQKFKKGDILRLTFTKVGNGTYKLFHDPASDESQPLYSSGGSTTGTDMYFECPFKLNL